MRRTLLSYDLWTNERSEDQHQHPKPRLHRLRPAPLHSSRRRRPPAHHPLRPQLRPDPRAPSPHRLRRHARPPRPPRISPLQRSPPPLRAPAPHHHPLPRRPRHHPGHHRHHSGPLPLRPIHRLLILPVLIPGGPKRAGCPRLASLTIRSEATQLRPLHAVSFSRTAIVIASLTRLPQYNLSASDNSKTTTTIPISSVCGRL